MQPNDVKKIVRKIADVANRAADARAVSFGTVLSRNPDGSLNVDDGKGGCVRQMPAKNVRVGEKIAIGTEPAIGTVTQLTTRYVVIQPLGGCPEDPRDPPKDIVPTTNAAGEERIASAGIESWEDDRDLIQGNGLGASCATWFGEKNTVALTNISGIIGGGGAVAANLRRRVVSTCPHTILYTLARTWVLFDLAGIPRAASAARLKLSLVSSTASLNAADVVVLPSDITSADVPITTADMNRFDRSIELGRTAIAGHTTGVNTYGVTIDLDLSLLDLAELPDELCFALLTEWDVDGIPPPTPVSVTDNIIYGDSFQFYTHASQGPPILELDIPLL